MSSCDLSSVNIVKGKDACWTFRLVNCSGSSMDITGWSFASLQFAGDPDSIAVYGPADAGVDEQQTITFSSVPTSGTFLLSLRGQLTASLPYNAAAIDVENALNALTFLSEVTVTGDMTTGFIVTFAGKDGKRNQPLLVSTSNLLNGVNSVSITVTETLAGRAESGIDVLDVATGLIQVKLSEEQTSKMVVNKPTKKQDMVLCVRIGPLDLNIPVLKGILNVEDNPFG